MPLKQRNQLTHGKCFGIKGFFPYDFIICLVKLMKIKKVNIYTYTCVYVYMHINIDVYVFA